MSSDQPTGVMVVGCSGIQSGAEAGDVCVFFVQSWPVVVDSLEQLGFDDSDIPFDLTEQDSNASTLEIHDWATLERYFEARFRGDWCRHDLGSFDKNGEVTGSWG